MFSAFLLGLLLAAGVSFLAYVKIPSLAPSLPLDENDSLRQWVAHGRFHNFNGHAIFYHDHVGSLLRHTFTSNEYVFADTINKPVLVLIHGYPMFSFDYAGMYPAMLDMFHVVAIDNLGAGLSDKPLDIQYTFALQADVVESVVDAVLAERRHLAEIFQLDRSAANDSVHLVSHDIGASVAQELLARFLNESHSPRLPLRSCVFLNGGLFAEKIVPHQPAAMVKMMRSKVFGPIMQLLTTYGGFSKSLASIYGAQHQPSEADLRLVWAAMAHKDGLLLLHKNTNYAVDRFKHSARLVGAMVNCSAHMPMLHINGPADTIAGRHMAEEFRRRVPAAVVALLDDSVGHFPHLEDPGAVVSTLRNFYLSKFGLAV